jgi:hypothetical protein
VKRRVVGQPPAVDDHRMLKIRVVHVIERCNCLFVNEVAMEVRRFLRIVLVLTWVRGRARSGFRLTTAGQWVALQRVSRGDRTPIDLFLEGVRSWTRIL